VALQGSRSFTSGIFSDKWFKVDVCEAHYPNASLMFPDDDADQIKVKDVLKGNTIWDGRYLKSIA
jgi:hypothetical protein